MPGPKADYDRAHVRSLVLEIIGRGWEAARSDEEFGDVALRVFRLQFERNAPYRAFCERRLRTPRHVEHWTQVPAVPTAAFKEVALVAGDPADADLVFRTSGTTRGAERRGSHYVLDPALYEASLLQSFQACVLPDTRQMHVISLVPSAAQAPDSSLSHMIGVVMKELGTAASETVTDASLGIDFARLSAALRQAERNEEPVCLVGTSFAFVHWLDQLRAVGESFSLPPGSRLMDTGGFKGRSREVPEPELRRHYDELLGIGDPFVINEYGMTEMCSQFYDAALRDHVLRVDGRPRKVAPPWVRSRVVHPETLEPMPPGTIGILQHFDLANLFSVACIQTEDQAVQVDDGFRLLGRAPGAAPRGCSIAMDLLLESVGRTSGS